MQPWKEKQRFSDNMVTLIILIPLLASLYIAYRHNSSTSLIIVISCFALVFLLIAVMKLEVIIDDQGVSYKYFPFHSTLRTVPWAQIQRYELIPVNAIKDFGGLGIRYNSKKKGYIINSKYGLELEQRDGKIVVISITDQEKAAAALRYFSPAASK